MNAVRQKPVRIGNQPAGNNRKLLIGGGAALAVIVVAVIIVVATSGSDDEEVEVVDGCQRDADCHPGSLCAAGGCMILTSKATPLVWREDIKDQLDPDAGMLWKPPPTYGEKLLKAERCPAALGKVVPPTRKAIVPVVKANVYEVLPDRVILHRHARVKADIWIDAHRFWFPELSTIDPKRVCTADKVAHVSIGKGSFRGKPAPYVDAAFARAAPAGVVATAAVSVTTDLPAPDPEGVRSFSFRLQPVLALDARYHSVITFPLGSDVLGIEGPPPSMQRLFRGYFAYYWEHSKVVSDVTIRFRPAEKLREKLDFANLNP